LIKLDFCLDKINELLRILVIAAAAVNRQRYTGAAWRYPLAATATAQQQVSTR
jgi:hypothetical protein